MISILQLASAGMAPPILALHVAVAGMAPIQDEAAQHRAVFRGTGVVVNTETVRPSESLKKRPLEVARDDKRKRRRREEELLFLMRSP